MNLSAQELPITELEAANEAAETLLTNHKDLVPSDLAALLSTFRSDLTVVIEDHCESSEAVIIDRSSVTVTYFKA